MVDLPPIQNSLSAPSGLKFSQILPLVNEVLHEINYIVFSLKGKGGFMVILFSSQEFRHG